MKRRILLVVAAAVALWAAQTAWRGSPAGAEEGTFLSFVSEPGDLIGQGHSLAFTPANSSIAAVALADLQEVHVSIFPFAGSFWILDMAAPAGQQLVPGVYEGATRWPLQAPSLPGLSFYGDGRGCNTLTGRFEVLEVVYEPSGLVDHFHTTFEQHCEGAEAPALFGEVMLINPPPPDSDGDGVTDEVDNCVFPANTDQADRDGDGIGDACDLDNDNDGFEDSIELSTGSDPLNPASTPEQSFVAPSSCTDSLDNDLDSLIDGEDSGCDGDGDGVLDTIDNCLSIPNPDQADRDEDGIGDACDLDNDNDGVENFIEIALGSHPFNPASTPEHPTAPFACTDGLDNDLDGHVDGDDLRCHPDFVVLTGADDEELFRQGRQHANEAHPEMNMSDDQIREFIKTDARDA